MTNNNDLGNRGRKETGYSAAKPALFCRHCGQTFLGTSRQIKRRFAKHACRRKA